jgi:cell division initiation protein
MNPKITAVDVQKHEFPTVRKGYDAATVRAFLSALSEELEELVRENSELSHRARRLEEENSEHREREMILKETLLTAQRVSEEMKANARKEAEVIVRQAELSGRELTAEALRQSAKIERAMREMKLQRANLRLKLKSMLEMFQAVLDIDREEDDSTGTVSYLVRPGDGTNAG